MFWIKVLPGYPELAIKALKTLLPCLTSCLCKSGFSVMAATKTKPRKRLDMRGTLRVSLSSIISRWGCLVAAKQAQGSHWIKIVITYMNRNKYSLLNYWVFWRLVRKKICLKPVRSAKKVADSWPRPCRVAVSDVYVKLQLLEYEKEKAISFS